jgi:hypothetical protein
MISKYSDYSNVLEICEKFGIKNWEISKDGLVDVRGDVDLHEKELDVIPLKFGIVTGYFDVERNNLTSLSGSPIQVGGDFACSNNKLESLIGSPKKIGEDFFCEENNIWSFVGLEEDSINSNRVDWGKGFFCLRNPVFQIWTLLGYDIESVYLLNEFGAVDRDKIIWERLLEVYHTLGRMDPNPNSVKEVVKNYQIIF